MSKTKDDAIPPTPADRGTPVAGSPENNGDPIVSGLAWTNAVTWSHPIDTSNEPHRTGGGPDATLPIGNQTIAPRSTKLSGRTR
jgi:hypothetical protein